MASREEIDLAMRRALQAAYFAGVGNLSASEAENEGLVVLKKDLNDLGVVLKVDRELLVCDSCEGTGLIGGPGINDCCPKCNGTGKIYCVGYVATESLIEEEHPIVTQLESGFSGIIQA